MFGVEMFTNIDYHCKDIYNNFSLFLSKEQKNKVTVALVGFIMPLNHPVSCTLRVHEFQHEQ